MRNESYLESDDENGLKKPNLTHESQFYLGEIPKSPVNKYIGKKATIKKSCEKSKISNKIETLKKADADKLVKEFIQLGGIIKDVEANKFIIKVESGSFLISKNFIDFS